MDTQLLLKELGWVALLFLLWSANAALQALSPGVYARSRYAYLFITLACSSALWMAARQMPLLLVALGFALWMTVFFARAMDTGHWGQAVAFFASGVLAALLEPPLLAMLLPMGIVLIAEYRYGRLGGALVLALGIVGGVWGYAEHFPLKALPKVEHWSLRYLFFHPPEDPNIALLWQPVAHPFFCMPLPALFLLFKKTDIGLYTRRVLVFCLAFLMLYHGGASSLERVQLLPAYALLLLILFPAWDRFFAYGSYFFPHLTAGLVAFALLCQGAALIFFHA